MKQTVYPKPEQAKLSVIIPAYNAEAWIGPTLKHLWAALSPTKWKSIEIIVVDDGSKDQTARVAMTTLDEKKVTVLSQENQGRFKTRKNGLDKASGDYIFFIDSRTYAHKNAFTFLVQAMKKYPEAVVWNGHIHIERKGNIQARFWYVVTFVAWRRYLAKPKLTHYGLKDFDYYPKGTTCFFAPKDLLVQAYEQFETIFEDLKYSNDDSSLIRYIAEKTDIYLDPHFAFTYNSRSTMKAFFKHTLHRGIVFIDGFLKPGTRYYYPLLIYLAGLPLAIVAAVLWPVILLAIPIGLMIVGLGFLALGVSPIDALSFVGLLPLFMVMYTTGLYKGLIMKSTQTNTN